MVLIPNFAADPKFVVKNWLSMLLHCIFSMQNSYTFFNIHIEDQWINLTIAYLTEKAGAIHSISQYYLAIQSLYYLRLILQKRMQQKTYFKNIKKSWKKVKKTKKQFIHLNIK